MSEEKENPPSVEPNVPETPAPAPVEEVKTEDKEVCDPNKDTGECESCQ